MTRRLGSWLLSAPSQVATIMHCFRNKTRDALARASPRPLTVLVSPLSKEWADIYWSWTGRVGSTPQAMSRQSPTYAAACPCIPLPMYVKRKHTPIDKLLCSAPALHIRMVLDFPSDSTELGLLAAGAKSSPLLLELHSPRSIRLRRFPRPQARYQATTIPCGPPLRS